MNQIYNLLRQLDPADLQSSVGAGLLDRISGLVKEEVKGFDVARYVLALYGENLLSERKLRCQLFTLLAPEVLEDLASRYTDNSYAKPYDNALALSLCPWKSGSGFVNEIASLLKIPVDYLPVSIASEATTELIEPAAFLHPLHSYQRGVADEISEQLSSKGLSVLVQMPTGAGKTRTTLQAIIEHVCENNYFQHGRSVLWLAHTQELCEQAIETFKKTWQSLGKGSAGVVRIWSGHSPKVHELSGSFIAATFQKMVAAQKSDQVLFRGVKSAADIIVTDEAHKVLAPTFRRAVAGLRNDATVIIGLTATPGRSTTAEDENSQLADLFDRNLITPNLGSNPIATLQEMGILSRLRRFAIESGLEVTLVDGDRGEIDESGDLSSNVISRIGKNASRNRTIVAEIEKQVKSGNPCIVFSCGIEHSRVLAAALILRGISASHVDGSMRRGVRKAAIEGFRSGDFDVLVNYGVLTTGFDAPRIRTVVVTRPTTSLVLYSQMIGRGLRGPNMGGGAECNLIDIKDNFTAFGDIDAVYNYFEDYWSFVS